MTSMAHLDQLPLGFALIAISIAWMLESPSLLLGFGIGMCAIPILHEIKYELRRFRVQNHE